MTSILYAIAYGDKGGTASHGKNKVAPPIVVGEGYNDDERRYIEENKAVFAVSSGQKTASLYHMGVGAFKRAPRLVQFFLLLAVVVFVLVIVPTIVCMLSNLFHDWDSYLMTFICMGALLVLFVMATTYIALRM